ncbi:hypothetical protein [Paenibacillus sp. GCM10023250]|uniref:hypothetical protein n=1 Tax=Paenibacillus sp. GCM10023250 TaxID=3252648 RepID=UPI00361399A4
MALYRRLVSDEDFTEAMERQFRLRVYKDDHIVDSGGIIIRFDDALVVSQSGVSEVTYHDRAACEFFEIRRR